MYNRMIACLDLILFLVSVSGCAMAGSGHKARIFCVTHWVNVDVEGIEPGRFFMHATQENPGLDERDVLSVDRVADDFGAGVD